MISFFAILLFVWVFAFLSAVFSEEESLIDALSIVGVVLGVASFVFGILPVFY